MFRLLRFIRIHSLIQNERITKALYRKKNKKYQLENCVYNNKLDVKWGPCRCTLVYVLGFTLGAYVCVFSQKEAKNSDNFQILGFYK